MTDAIVLATTPDDYAAFGVLIREYWDWLRSRYAEMVDAIGDHQGLTDELNSLSTVYGPPNGKAFLALREGEVVGAIAGFGERPDGTEGGASDSPGEPEPWASATPVAGSSVAMPSGHGPSRGNTTAGWVTDE